MVPTATRFSRSLKVHNDSHNRPSQPVILLSRLKEICSRTFDPVNIVLSKQPNAFWAHRLAQRKKHNSSQVVSVRQPILLVITPFEKGSTANTTLFAKWLPKPLYSKISETCPCLLNSSGNMCSVIVALTQCESCVATSLQMSMYSRCKAPLAK